MIYLDTNVIVYAIENHPKYGKSCIEILEAIEAKQLEASASILVLVELVNVLVKINRILAQEGKQLLQVKDNIDAVLSLPIVWFDLDLVIIRRAAEYAYEVTGVDYFHIASMELHSVNQIISADKELDVIPFIKRLDPLKYQL